MNNLILLVLLTVPLWVSAQQIDTKLLEGQWLLADITSNDSIWVSIHPDAQEPVSTGPNKNGSTERQKKKVAVADYMKKDLTCGVTRFVFQGNTFQFYRGEALTFSGTITVKGKQLLLEYDNGNGKNTKENTIVTLTAGNLVLSSESKEQPVLLSFFKK